MSIGNPVTLAEAQASCLAWRTLYTEMFPGISDPDIFRGFYIHIDDIKALAALHDAVAVRAYIGSGGPSEITGQRLRLMLVPVKPDTDGNILPGKDEIEPIPGEPGLFSIYDFTMPCPQQCDQSSVLYDIDMTIINKPHS